MNIHWSEKWGLERLKEEVKSARDFLRRKEEADAAREEKGE
jgi:hypothetical protein